MDWKIWPFVWSSCLRTGRFLGGRRGNEDIPGAVDPFAVASLARRNTLKCGPAFKQEREEKEKNRSAIRAARQKT